MHLRRRQGSRPGHVWHHQHRRRPRRRPGGKELQARKPRPQYHRPRHGQHRWYTVDNGKKLQWPAFRTLVCFFMRSWRHVSGRRGGWQAGGPVHVEAVVKASGMGTRSGGVAMGAARAAAMGVAEGMWEWRD